MCSRCYCLRLPGEVAEFFFFFLRLPPSVTLYIRIAASGDKHFIRHGFSEELTKNFFFRYFSYDEHIRVNKFITNTIDLSMNRELFLYVSAIIHGHLQGAQNTLKDIYSGSTQLCQSRMVKHTMQAHRNSTTVQCSQC